MNAYVKKLISMLIISGLILGALPFGNKTVKAKAAETVSAAALSERTVNFNDNWSFKHEPEGNPEKVDFDDSSWQDITLPHDWSIHNDFDRTIGASVGSLRGGNGWYRKSFVLPKEYQGKRINIDFDGVYEDSYIYVNGKLVGNYPNGYIPFSFDITDYVVCDGVTENVIAVSVTNVTNEDGMGYTSRWYSGSGIYRDTYLTVTEPVHVAQYGVKIRTPKLEEEYPSGKVTVEVTTEVENELKEAAQFAVRNTVMNYYGVQPYEGAEAVTSTIGTVEPGETFVVSHGVPVKNPELWDIDNGKLYTMKTEILMDGKVVDTYNVRFGFKYFNFDANKGFSINGKWTKIKGVCLHHDQGALGAEGNEAAFRRQIQIMKDMGINAIRTSHNAASPKFIKLCDEMGVMVFEESFDSWWIGKNAHDYAVRFFEQPCTHPDAAEGTVWPKYDLQQIIRKDRNSPCIIMWGIGNECNETSENKAISVVADVIDWVKEMDEDHPVTMGENKYKLDWANPKIMNQVHDQLDIVGLNYGEAYYDAKHEEYPDWIIFGSETASTVSSRGYYADPWITGNHQVDNVDGNLASDAVKGKHVSEYDNRSTRWGRNVTESLIFDRDREYIAGQFVWTGFDYIGEPAPHYSSKSSYFGIVDTCGFAKDRYYLYQSQWTDVDSNPMVHIMPHWNWEDDTLREKVTYPEKSEIEYLGDKERVEYSDDAVGKIPMRIYSNAPSVELFVDGVSQGKKSFAQKKTNYGLAYQQQSETSDRLYLEWPLAWEYKVGTTIEAVAYDKDGKEIARDKVVTAGEADKLSVSADRNVIVSDGSDLCYITVDVHDADGNFVPTADNKISFTVEGEGEIVGVDNGDPSSKERYKDTDGEWSRSAFNGKALVIVRSTKNTGSFTLKAESLGLASDEITISTKAYTPDLSEDKPTVQPTQPTPVPGATAAPTVTPGASEKGESNVTNDTFKKKGIVYKITNAVKKTVEVKSTAKKNIKKAVIPATVKYNGKNYKVTSIGKNAFKNCKKLKKAVIGKNVVKVHKTAFKGCKKLKNKNIVIKNKKLKKAEIFS